MLPPPRLSDLPPSPGRPDDAEPAAPRRPLLARTIKLCLALGLAGFGLTQYLSRGTHGLRASVLAWVQTGSDPRDPETTGSIAGPARRVVLDPCAADLRLR